MTNVLIRDKEGVAGKNQDKRNQASRKLITYS